MRKINFFFVFFSFNYHICLRLDCKHGSFISNVCVHEYSWNNISNFYVCLSKLVAAYSSVNSQNRCSSSSSSREFKPGSTWAKLRSRPRRGRRQPGGVRIKKMTPASTDSKINTLHSRRTETHCEHPDEKCALESTEDSARDVPTNTFSLSTHAKKNNI